MWKQTFRLIVPPDVALPVTVKVQLWDKDWHQADSEIASVVLSIGLGKAHVHSELKLKNPRKVCCSR